MTPSPLQTYLDERLQSARGLGWPVGDGVTEPRTALPPATATRAPARNGQRESIFALPNLLTAWLRAIR